MGQLEEALQVLTAYTSKLEEEAEQRQENGKLLDVFTWQQQHLLYQANLKQKVQWLSSLCSALISHDLQFCVLK